MNALTVIEGVKAKVEADQGFASPGVEVVSAMIDPA